jgi:hypothetical protein
LSVAIVWIKEGKHFTHVGPGIEAINGYTIEEVTAKPMGELITPSTLQYLKQNY